MKKNYTIALALSFCFYFAVGQVTIVDQPVVGTNGIISDFITGSGFGTYSADDFTLDDDYIIETITAPGFGSAGSDISVNLTGLDLYIYTDVGGLPSSDPSNTGAGVLEIINLPPSSPALTIVDGTITVDIEVANGAEVELSAGTYWLVIAPAVPEDAVRWNWFASDPGGNAVLIDEGNFGGLPWTDFGSLGLSFDSLAFSIVGSPALSVDEYGLSQIAVTPNPTTAFINIDIPNNSGSFVSELYDITGKQVLRKENLETLNVSQLNSGIYILRIKTDNAVVSRRIIKE